MKKKSGISIYLMQILFALIPLSVGIIVVMVSSVLQLDSQMEKSTFSRLETAAIATARYFEYDINEGILAQDDTSIAVTGDLGWGDYVITTSSAPVKNGDMVRLADN